MFFFFNSVNNEPDNQPPPKKIKKPPKIFDGNFYTIEQLAENGNIVAKCEDCGELKKGNISSTGNYKNHYKSKHSNRYIALENYLKETKLQNQAEKPKTDRQPAITQCFGENLTGEIVSIAVSLYLVSIRNHN